MSYSWILFHTDTLHSSPIYHSLSIYFSSTLTIYPSPSLTFFVFPFPSPLLWFGVFLLSVLNQFFSLVLSSTPFLLMLCPFTPFSLASVFFLPHFLISSINIMASPLLNVHLLVFHIGPFLSHVLPLLSPP